MNPVFGVVGWNDKVGKNRGSANATAELNVCEWSSGVASDVTFGKQHFLTHLRHFVRVASFARIINSGIG